MNVKYSLHNIIFEWDSQKATTNFRKHGIHFETACEAFFDPFICCLDDEMIAGELREKIIGYSTKLQMLFVVYVSRKDVFRVISARLATNSEREIYENQ